MERSYSSGRFAFVCDGQTMGYVKSCKGGIIKAELATHQLGTELIQKKHITNLVYEPFTVEVGMGMSATFYEWIRASFESGHISKSGEVHAMDFDGKSMSCREFSDALITEVTMPALDASNKEPAYMTLKLEPEDIRYTAGTGSVIQGQVGPATKKWQNSNFRIEIGDLPCARVSKLDSFTWKQGIAKDEVGMFRRPTKHPAKVEVPNLKLTISMADIKAWEDWHREFVINGVCGEESELTGSITYLGPDLEEELASIDLLNLGIISLDASGFEANKEEVARFTVELYCEAMKFNYSVKDA